MQGWHVDQVLVPADAEAEVLRQQVLVVERIRIPHLEMEKPTPKPKRECQCYRQTATKG